MKITKELLLKQDFEFTNERGDLIEVSFLANTFALILNGRCIKATKTIAPIQNKLNFLLSL
jgi:hypothetical protein